MSSPTLGGAVDVDVVVVGAGAAGLAAAVEAASRGARVLVAESEPVPGGSSRRSGGWLQAAGTSVQRAAGIDDAPGAMLHEYLVANRWGVETGLARTLCEGAPLAVEWLTGFGAAVGAPVRAGGEAVPRGIRVVGEGEGLIDALVRAARAAGVEIACGNRVERLLVEHGAVCGVVARGESLRAAAVVLASGGFARNAALLDRHVRTPPADAHGARFSTLAGDGSRGDALALAAPVDAAHAGLGRALWVSDPLTPASVVLVDPEGRRFVDESADFTVAALAAGVWGGEQVAIFDEAARRAPRFAAIEQTAAGALFTDGPIDLAAEPVRTWVARGDLVRGASVREVATAIGLDGDAVVHTVARYDAACAAGHDDQFEKPAAWLTPLVHPPYYALRVRPSVLIATFGGLQIDRCAQVLDRDGRPVAGLFAAGEAAGGVVGDVYVGHGNSLTAALVFGRLAGAGAADRAAR